MFVLCEMQDVIRVEPRYFKVDMQRQISDELNKKLANKVVHGVGLVIAFQDLLHVGECFILPGDGSSHTRVKFRAIVFRPFIGEVLVGKVRRCSPEGVHGFFHDILIPADSLQYPSKFDKDEQLWVWEYRVDDSIHDMYMDVDEDIRFRIIDDTFVDVIPKSEPPSSAPRTPNPSLHQPHSMEEEKESKDQQHLAPFSITGTINDPGLGLLSWWTES